MNLSESARVMKNESGASRHDRFTIKAVTGGEGKNRGASEQSQASRLRNIGQGVNPSESARVLKTSLA